MISLQNVIGQELKWVRPRWTQQFYELQVGGQVIATLSRSGIFKERVLAEAQGQRWTFKRQGSFKVRLLIYAGEEPVGEPVAVFNRRWTGKGELIYADGRTFCWSRTGFWSPIQFWMTPEGISLLSMKRGKKLEISPDASNLPELPLLTLFGLYLILLAEQEAAAAAASV